MADKRNRTPFYGAVPTTSLHADHVIGMNDFIIETSTIDGWTVEKWNSGKCIAYKDIPNTSSVSGWTQEGSLYFKGFTITLPAYTFIAAPTYFNAVVCSSNLVFYIPSNMNTTLVNGFMTASQNYSARSYQIKCLAIGAWK